MKDWNTKTAENEALIDAMLGEDSNPSFKLGYLISFLSQAMLENPELKEKVEQRILFSVKHRAKETA